MNFSNFRCVHIPGWYDVTVTPEEGEPFDYTVSPDDDAPLAVTIRGWVLDHPGTIFAAFVPPTTEELRAGFPKITPRQLRLMLLSIDMTPADVEAQINTITDPIEQAAAHIEWDYATSYSRNHPLVLSLAAAMNFIPEQLDDLWLNAATI